MIVGISYQVEGGRLLSLYVLCGEWGVNIMLGLIVDMSYEFWELEIAMYMFHILKNTRGRKEKNSELHLLWLLKNILHLNTSTAFCFLIFVATSSCIFGFLSF